MIAKNMPAVKEIGLLATLALAIANARRAGFRAGKKELCHQAIHPARM